MAKKESKAIGEKMLKIMYANNGYGLAAPQVGFDQRIFVMRDPHAESKGLIFVNPEIMELGPKSVRDWEGCLSLLSHRAMIDRATEVYFEFDDPDEEDKRLQWRFEGMNARCVQHEIEHLDGIMIFDHIGGLSQKLFLEKYGKAKKKHDRLG